MENTHETAPNTQGLPLSHDLPAVLHDTELEALVDRLFADSDAATMQIGNRCFFDPLKAEAQSTAISPGEALATQPETARPTAQALGNLAVDHTFRLTA